MWHTLIDYIKVSVIAAVNFALSLTGIDELLKVLIGFVSLVYIALKLVFLFKDRANKNRRYSKPK